MKVQVDHKLIALAMVTNGAGGLGVGPKGCQMGRGASGKPEKYLIWTAYCRISTKISEIHPGT